MGSASITAQYETRRNELNDKETLHNTDSYALHNVDGAAVFWVGGLRQ